MLVQFHNLLLHLQLYTVCYTCYASMVCELHLIVVHTCCIHLGLYVTQKVEIICGDCCAPVLPIVNWLYCNNSNISFCSLFLDQTLHVCLYSFWLCLLSICVSDTLILSILHCLHIYSLYSAYSVYMHLIRFSSRFTSVCHLDSSYSVSISLICFLSRFNSVARLDSVSLYILVWYASHFDLFLMLQHILS